MSEQRGINPEEIELMGKLHDGQVGKPHNGWVMIAGVDDNGTFYINHGDITPTRINLFNESYRAKGIDIELQEDGLYSYIPFSEAGIPTRVRIAPPDELYQQYLEENSSSITIDELEDDLSLINEEDSTKSSKVTNRLSAPSFKTRLKQLRKGFQPPLKQSDVADRSGLSLDWIRKIEQERAENPSIQSLIAIGRALDLDGDDLKSFVKSYPR